jgi:hypothetical protein
VRKAVVAFLGFLLTLILELFAQDLIPESAKPYILVFIGVCTSYGVFAVRNAPSGRHVDINKPIE